MNSLLNYFTQYLKDWDAGRLLDKPDGDEPGDIGGAITQDDIDFVKRMRKEVTRYGSCDVERDDTVITNFTPESFTLNVHQSDYGGSVLVCYKLSGDTDGWVFAPGDFDGDDYVLASTAGLVGGSTYDFRVQNVCPNGIVSNGFVLTDAEVEEDL